MQRRVSDPWMESFRAGLSCSRSPFLNQWMVLTTMSPAFCTYLYYNFKDLGKLLMTRDALLCCLIKKDPLYPIDSRYPCSMNVSTEARLRSRDGCMCGGWATAADRGNNNTLAILKPDLFGLSTTQSWGEDHGAGQPGGKTVEFPGYFLEK